MDTEAVVLDMFAGLDLDAFGAAVGTVRGGGLIVLFAPPLHQWPSAPDPLRRTLAVAPWTEADVGDRLVRRFAAALERAEGVTIVPVGPAGAARPVLAAPSVVPVSTAELVAVSAAPSPPHDPAPRTADQAAAVDALLAMAVDSDPRPLVLVSDRGRGKSSALGLAAGRLLADGSVAAVLVTAPSREAAFPLFERAAEVMRDLPAPRPVFVPAERLASGPEPGALLLVDEAAALPVDLLERLLRACPRIAFATTVHGYEGTGRGFAVRFRGTLDREAPGWLELRLHEPIRWAAGDPIERLAFSTLLLDASPADAPEVAGATPDACELAWLDRDDLARDEGLLRELFGLLVLAHYRTSPSDLRRLLDAPNLDTAVLRWDGRVVAAALVASEGGLEPAACEAIALGRTRPRGHMLPEVLSSHLGRPEAASWRSARVVRIAVHPARQRCGLGARLLDGVVLRARERGCALAGAGFGATRDLLRFWGGCGFLPAWLGVRPGAASGIPSLVVLRPLDGPAETLVAGLGDRLARQLPHILSDALRGLDPALAADLLRRDGVPEAPDLDPRDWQDLFACAFGPRIYDAAVGPVWNLVRASLADPETQGLLDERSRLLLVAKVLQKRPWPEVVTGLGFASNHEAMRALRAALAPLALRWGGEEASAARARFAGHGTTE